MSERKSNSNLEFRKIKSLKFLYEINENGTILRNVKSKKQVPMHREFSGWVGEIKGKPVDIRQLVAECWLGTCPPEYELRAANNNKYDNDYRNLCYVKVKPFKFTGKPVYLIKGYDVWSFNTTGAAAAYIAWTQHRNQHTVEQAIKHRQYAYGYDIFFPNAETRRAGSTEQGIVHFTVDEMI